MSSSSSKFSSNEFSTAQAKIASVASQMCASSSSTSSSSSDTSALQQVISPVVYDAVSGDLHVFLSLPLVLSAASAECVRHSVHALVIVQHTRCAAGDGAQHCYFCEPVMTGCHKNMGT